MAHSYLLFRDAFAALDPDRYPVEYIDKQVANGRWRCWGNEHAAILAEIKVYPSGVKEVHGVAAAGDLATIVGLIPLAEQWGLSKGCVAAEIDSTAGWARLMAQHGYTPVQLRIRKELR